MLDSKLELIVIDEERIFKEIEDFKVFGIAKNGVKILSKDGKEDCFVLNQSDRFKNLLVNNV